MTLALMSCIRFPSHVRVRVSTTTFAKYTVHVRAVRVFHCHKTQNTEKPSSRQIQQHNIDTCRQNR